MPTFGAFIRSRSSTPNRIILFDIAIAGPIAGLVVAIIVSMYAAYEAPYPHMHSVSYLKSRGESNSATMNVSGKSDNNPS